MDRGYCCRGCAAAPSTLCLRCPRFEPRAVDHRVPGWRCRHLKKRLAKDRARLCAHAGQSYCFKAICVVWFVSITHSGSAEPAEAAAARHAAVSLPVSASQHTSRCQCSAQAHYIRDVRLRMRSRSINRVLWTLMAVFEWVWGGRCSNYQRQAALQHQHLTLSPRGR